MTLGRVLRGPPCVAIVLRLKGAAVLVRMLVNITGFRNGAEWPPAGEVIDLPDTEARDLVLARYAEHVNEEDTVAPVTDEPDAPTADEPPAEADEVEAAADEAEPDVDGLLARAAELGIKADRRMKPETIAAKIAEAG